MTLNLTPKQLAGIIASAVRATLTQLPTAVELDNAIRAASKNAAQAVYNVSVEALADE